MDSTASGWLARSVCMWYALTWRRVADPSHSPVAQYAMSDSTLVTPGEKIAIACDHAGLDLKSALKDDLCEMGFAVLDLGVNLPESVDYPDFGRAVAEAICNGEARAGVAICGTGIGISIAANRYPEIRAALVHDAFTARLAREHNNANVIALGARAIGIEVARDCIRIFFETLYLGGRHQRRVRKLSLDSNGQEF